MQILVRAATGPGERAALVVLPAHDAQLAPPELAIDPPHLRAQQQVADVNIGQLWMNTDAYVLAMHGTSDFVSSAIMLSL